MAKTSNPSTAAPTHHPSEAILIDYASGAMSLAESLLIDVHLEACRQCRRTAHAACAIGGVLLETIAPAQLPQDLFERTLQSIEALASDAAHTPSAPAVPPFAATWPEQLRSRLASRPLPPWRRLPAGFRALRIPFEDRSSRVWIMDAPGGRGPLSHSHVRDEWTVVLEGGFTDETGTYAAGDFAFMGAGDQHRMIAEPGEGCVCLLLIRKNPRYTTLVGKLLSPLLRL